MDERDYKAMNEEEKTIERIFNVYQISGRRLIETEIGQDLLTKTKEHISKLLSKWDEQIEELKKALEKWINLDDLFINTKRMSGMDIAHMSAQIEGAKREAKKCLSKHKSDGE